MRPSSEDGLAAMATVVYVDAANGQPGNPGTSAKPVPTILEGIQLTRTRAKPAMVVVRAGVYRQSEPIVLGSADSDVTIQGLDGAWISGAQLLPNLSWSPYNVSAGSWSQLSDVNNAHGCNRDDPNDPSCGCRQTEALAACQAIANSTAAVTSYTWHDVNQGVWKLQCCLRRDGVWQPYNEAGHTSGQRLPQKNIYVATVRGTSHIPQLRVNGMRMPRARHPNANPETQQFPVGWASSVASDWIKPPPSPPPVYVNVSNPQIALRGSSDFQTYSGGIGGPCQNFDPPFSYWCSANPSGGGGFQYYVPEAFRVPPNALPALAWSHNWSPNNTTNVPVAHVWRNYHVRKQRDEDRLKKGGVLTME